MPFFEKCFYCLNEYNSNVSENILLNTYNNLKNSDIQKLCFSNIKIICK